LRLLSANHNLDAVVEMAMRAVERLGGVGYGAPEVPKPQRHGYGAEQHYVPESYALREEEVKP